MKEKYFLGTFSKTLTGRLLVILQKKCIYSILKYLLKVDITIKGCLRYNNQNNRHKDLKITLKSH